MKRHLWVLRYHIRERELRAALGFLLRDLMWQPLSRHVPLIVRRYWIVGLLGIVLLACQGTVLLWTLNPFDPSFISTLKMGVLTGPSVRLGVARLATAVLTFILATLGTVLAIGELRKAAERPRLLLLLSDGTESVYIVVPLTGEQGTWEHLIPLRIHNMSNVMAEHIEARVWFKKTGPFEVKLSCDEQSQWQGAEKQQNGEWVCRPTPGFVIHGNQKEIIGSIEISLPAEAAKKWADLEHSYKLAIDGSVYDASGHHERRLTIGLVPSHKVAKIIGRILGTRESNG